MNGRSRESRIVVALALAIAMGYGQVRRIAECR